MSRESLCLAIDLMCPVVSDPKKASIALQKLVAEMERRYDLFSEKNVKNIKINELYFMDFLS